MKLFYSLIKFIETCLLWFYPPFKRLMPLQTFKYAATGGANTAMDIFLYFIFYNFVLNKELVDLGFIVISPYIAAFIMAFSFTFPIGFILAKYISFPGSFLRKRIQLFRYALSVSGSVLINYVFIKIFVEVCGWYPTPSKIVTTLIAVLFSYMAQKYFTFKVKLSD